MGARDPLPGCSASSRELLVDPGVRFRRLDAARQGNLIREKLACFHEELLFARRELRLGAFRGQRPLAMRAVTDDLCELEETATCQFRLRVPAALEPGIPAYRVICAQR